MSVSEADRCCHPECVKYSDMTASPCSKCDAMLGRSTYCRHCGQKDDFVKVL